MNPTIAVDPIMIGMFGDFEPNMILEKPHEFPPLSAAVKSKPENHAKKFRKIPKASWTPFNLPPQKQTKIIGGPTTSKLTKKQIKKYKVEKKTNIKMVIPSSILLWFHQE